MVSNGTGNQVQAVTYYPFGLIRTNQGTVDLPHKFTGQEYDPETGLYYFGARYYDPALARFITPDTIVQAPADPQSLNRYAYCRNNPLMYTDPSGHFFWAFHIALAMVFTSSVAAGLTGGNPMMTMGLGVVTAGMGIGLGGALSSSLSSVCGITGAANGAISGGVAGAASGFISGAASKNLGLGMLMGAGIGAAMGAAFGAMEDDSQGLYKGGGYETNEKILDYKFGSNDSIDFGIVSIKTYNPYSIENNQEVAQPYLIDTATGEGCIDFEVYGLRGGGTVSPWREMPSMTHKYDLIAHTHGAEDTTGSLYFSTGRWSDIQSAFNKESQIMLGNPRGVIKYYAPSNYRGILPSGAERSHVYILQIQY